MEKKRPNEIKTHPTFESLFPIHPALLEKIEEDMRDGTYDASQPIILATWEGQEEPVCIDGHTRLKAASNVGIEEVPVWLHEFETEEEAVEKAIKLQANRRNMTDAELLTCMEALDQRGRAGRPKKELAPNGANKIAEEKSAGQTGELLGISTRKVERVRTVMDHADAATKEAVKSGEKSINQAYNETQNQRKSKKVSTQEQTDTKSEAGQGASWPEPVTKATANVGRSAAAENDHATSLGKSVTVNLLDWQYNALRRLDGYMETHVTCAVGFYLESLGIREEPEDDDEDYFDASDYDEN